MKNNEKKLWQEARNEVLRSYDPYIWVEKDMCIEETLGFVMESVYKYIVECLNMDDNPLCYLRKYFPCFEWKFHEPKDVKDLFQIIIKADYIWPTDNLDWSCGIITAKQNNKKPRILCYSPKDYKWPIEFEKLGCAKFVSLENCETIIK